jgi:hypothetical protein
MNEEPSCVINQIYCDLDPFGAEALRSAATCEAKLLFIPVAV